MKNGKCKVQKKSRYSVRKIGRIVPQREIRCFVLLICCFALIMFAASCDYREIESLSVVSGVGIDYNVGSGEYVLTLEILDSTKNNESTVLVRSQGNTIAQAVDNAIEMTGKRIFFAHAKVIVIGEEAARQGISKLLDYFFRNNESRIDIDLCVTKDITAEELMSTEPVITGSLMFETGKMFDATHKTISVPLYKVVNVLHDDNLSLTLCALNLSELSEDNQTVVSCGLGVFSEDKLVTYLDKDQTATFLFAMAETNTESRYTLNSQMTLKILSSKGEIKASYENGVFMFTMNIDSRAEVEELTTEKDSYELAEISDAKLQEEIKNLIESMQKKKLDIFGLSSIAARDCPGQYEQIKNDWADYFANAEFIVRYKTKIEKTGQIQKSLVRGNEQDG